jgi:GSH-dependent disulfide-bond oxidoreductase
MIDLYMWGTANGLRAAVAMAECGLEHRIHKVDITKGESRTPEFLKMNPAGAIPVMVDSDGPGGKPFTLAQSGAIVVYACQKAGRFVPADARRREIASQWFMLAASDVAGTSSAVFRLEVLVPEKSAANTDFFKNQLLGYFRVIDQQLAGREYLADEISYADLMLYPNYAARKPLIEAAGGMENLKRWGERMAARPGVKKGMSA